MFTNQQLDLLISNGNDDATKVLARELRRLRRRTHEIQERADKVVSQLYKEFESARITVGIIDECWKEGSRWYWDEMKLARRPLHLSIHDAVAYGILVNQRNRAFQIVEKIEKLLTGEEQERCEWWLEQVKEIKKQSAKIQAGANLEEKFAREIEGQDFYQKFLIDPGVARKYNWSLFARLKWCFRILFKR